MSACGCPLLSGTNACEDKVTENYRKKKIHTDFYMKKHCNNNVSSTKRYLCLEFMVNSFVLSKTLFSYLERQQRTAEMPSRSRL